MRERDSATHVGIIGLEALCGGLGGRPLAPSSGLLHCFSSDTAADQHGTVMFCCSDCTKTVSSAGAVAGELLRDGSSAQAHHRSNRSLRQRERREREHRLVPLAIGHSARRHACSVDSRGVGAEHRAVLHHHAELLHLRQ